MAQDAHRADLNVEEILHEERAQRILASGDIRALMKWMAELDEEFEEPYRRALDEGLRDVDGVVCHALAIERVGAIAATRSLPVLPINTFPTNATGDFDHPLLPLPTFGLRFLRKAGAGLWRRLWWRGGRGGERRRRRRGRHRALAATRPRPELT